MSDNKSENKCIPKVRVRTGVKAGPFGSGGVGGGSTLLNHGVRVRTGVKAGGTRLNHGIRVRQPTR